MKFYRIGAPGDPFGFLTSIVAKHLKIEGVPFHDNFFFLEKKSHKAEKVKGGLFETFQNPFCRRRSKN